jgi:hypothetical protein
MIYLRSLVVLLALLAIPVFGGPKIPIEVNHTSDEQIGERLAYAVKERIRKSEALTLTSEGTRFVLIIDAIDPDSDEAYRGARIVFSTTWLLRDEQRNATVYIAASMGKVGAKVINDIADSIVAHTDKIVAERSR